MTQFQLKISSSSGLFYEGTCESLVVPTSEGEYGVLANHVSMVIGIAIGILRYKLDGKWYYIAVGQGFARVVGNTVTMVVDSAERPEDVDAKRAQEAKERAEERIALQTSRKEYYRGQMAMARAMTRLKIKEKKFM